jgi:hypothetical protein
LFFSLLSVGEKEGVASIEEERESFKELSSFCPELALFGPSDAARSLKRAYLAPLSFKQIAKWNRKWKEKRRERCKGE